MRTSVLTKTGYAISWNEVAAFLSALQSLQVSVAHLLETSRQRMSFLLTFKMLAHDMIMHLKIYTMLMLSSDWL